MARRRKTDPVPEAISPAVISPATEAVIEKAIASVPTPDLAHAEKIRSTVLNSSAKVLALMRQAGAWPKSTVNDRQFVADIQRAEPALDGHGKTCLSVLFGSLFIFLITAAETSQFDQESGQEMVFDLGGGVWIAVIQT